MFIYSILGETDERGNLKRISIDHLPSLPKSEEYPPKDKYDVGYYILHQNGGERLLNCSSQEGCLLWVPANLIDPSCRPIDPIEDGDDGPIVRVFSTDAGTLWHSRAELVIFEGITTLNQAVLPAGRYYFVVQQHPHDRAIQPQIKCLRR